MTGPAKLRACCVILTMGDRPDEVARAVRSVREQDGDPVDILVVGNGTDLPDLPAGARSLVLPHNVGIPAGRNAGVAATSADVVVFLDDDGWLADRRAIARLLAAFEADDALGIVSFRISDPLGGRHQRRHVPRLRAGDPERSSFVTTFLGGGCAVRRAVFDTCGEFAGEFFFGHEETDFAWRALDAGFTVRYDAGVEMFHPAAAPSRHREFYRLTARNRVWLARRRLPWPVAAVYLLDWAVLTVLRTRRAVYLRAWFGGFVEGWRRPCGPRRPIRTATMIKMARLGRPPVI